MRFALRRAPNPRTSGGKIGLITAAAACLVTTVLAVPAGAHPAKASPSSPGAKPASNTSENTNLRGALRAAKPAPKPISPVLRNKHGKAVAHMHLTRQETAQNREAQAAEQGVSPFSVTNSNMVYHGGRVMRSPVNYAIFWQPTGTTAFPSDYAPGIQRFFQDIGGTPFYNMITQYGDSTGAPVPNATSFGGAWTDTNAFPHAGTIADPLSDGDIHQAVNDAIGANPAWQSPGLGTEYFVYLPSGVAQCFSSTECFALPGEGANGVYCAYHSHFSSETIYSMMPFTGNSNGCSVGAPSPNNNSLDSELNVTEHEMLESNTDPNGDAWFGPGGLDDENGDKCNFDTSPSYPNGVDIVLHGRGYRIQTEWSNEPVSGCVKRFGPEPSLSLSGSLDFGTVPRGTSRTRDITVTNGGGGDANLLDIQLDASSDPAYSLVGVPPTTATLGAGQSRTITVKYTAPANTTGSTQPQGTLIVNSDDPPPNDGKLTVSASATVGVPDLELSPAQINFSGTACGGTVLDQTLTATNDGTAPVTISNVALGPGSSPALSVLPLTSLPLTLQPGAQAGFTIELNGSAAGPGPVTGSVVVTSDDPKSPQSVLGTHALGFGGVPVDNRTAPDDNTLPLIVSNTGTCPLSVTGLPISGPNAGDYSVVAPPSFPVTITPGHDLTFSVRYNPSAAGSGTATLTVTSDDPTTPSAAVALAGNGLIPAINPATGQLIFPPTVISGQVPGYQGTGLNEHVTNTGQAELIVDALTTATPFTAQPAANPPNRYAPNDGFDEPVGFNPSATGKFTGTLTIADNAPEAPVSATVPLCGEGVKRGIRVLVVNGNGTPYQTVDKLTLQSHGTSVHVNDHPSGLSLVPVTTSCVSGEQRQYENQNLPATDSLNQRGSFYSLSVSAGGKSTSLTFTLAPTEFKTLVVTVK
jgi:hypothetical protein